MKKWNNQDIKKWSESQEKKRSYASEVLTKINSLAPQFKTSEYAQLGWGENTYPLYLIETKLRNSNNPTVLVTGGVHGYETSGVHGALMFMEQKAKDYESDFNFVCAPCISPWAYETINRWNPEAIDPNRNFTKDSTARECKFLYDKLQSLDYGFIAHFDLHETTDTDNTVFRPDLEKRDGVKQELWEIPDGFYLVADTYRQEKDFQEAIIKSVEKITHIAPSDSSGKIIGVPVIAKGIIDYDVNKLNLCAGLTRAKYVTTTEVYPDSPNATPKQCTQAQAQAIVGGLEYIRENK